MARWVWLCFGLACTCACGDGAPPADGGGRGAELGFLLVDADSYELSGTPLASSPTRLFYNFHPAERDAHEAPLLVVTAGGPGSAVSLLTAWNTAPTTVSLEAGGQLVSNPNALTRFANVLYVDARNAGFSYSWLPDPSDPDARALAFSLANYNVYRDAADVLTVLLAFFERHPALAANPTFLVGESYGALRNTVMLNLLLFGPTGVGAVAHFASPALLDRISEHLRAWVGDPRPSPERIAALFPGQILLEPALAGSLQMEISGALFEEPGSVVDRIASEHGVEYVRCADRPPPCDAYVNARELLVSLDRSPYDLRRPADFLEAGLERTMETLSRLDALAQVLGVPRGSLQAALATREAGAYRFADPGQALSTPEGDLGASIGPLPVWDAYLMAVNLDVTRAFASSAVADHAAAVTTTSLGELFLQNLRQVRTFVSRGAYDLVAYGPAVAPTLRALPGVEDVVPAYDDGELEVRFDDGLVRTLSSPEYASSHFVTLDAAEALGRDLGRFLTAPAPP